MKLISGSSNHPLADKIAQQLKVETVKADISRFNNGEKRVWIQGNLRGENVILVQSFSVPTDEHIMEFLLLTDALERMGVRHVNLVLPWMGYSRQDKVFRDGEPIAAKVVANLVSNSYVKRAFLLDLHNSSTTGFFSIPTEHLSAMELFAESAKDRFGSEDLIVASPDFGGLKRAHQFAQLLGTEVVNIDKHRDLHSGEVTARDMSGQDVTGKIAILFDDCLFSGGTAIEAGRLLREKGASEVHFFSTHGLFTGDALKDLEASSLDSVTVSNSVHHTQLPEKIRVVDTSTLFANSLTDWI